jgi:hypothetical protein
VSSARAEYASSAVFRRFAVSSLVQNTDLPINEPQLEFESSAVDGSIVIRTLYRSAQDTSFVLIGGDRVSFAKDDTIQLYISRKYTADGLKGMLTNHGSRILESVPYATAQRGATLFGTTLSLCQFDQQLLDQRPARSEEVTADVESHTARAHRRPMVFVSYAHKDARWLTELKRFLEPDLSRGVIELWDDTMIEPGREWRGAIEEALATCTVAVLLVTQMYVASDYISKRELPGLLKAAEERGVPIIWIPVETSRWPETDLEKLQAARSPQRTLDSVSTAERKAAWVALADRIKKAALARRDWR